MIHAVIKPVAPTDVVAVNYLLLADDCVICKGDPDDECIVNRDECFHGGDVICSKCGRFLYDLPIGE